MTGGQVGIDRSRLDFNLSGNVPAKEWVTEETNKLIALDRPVSPQWITDEELADVLYRTDNGPRVPFEGRLTPAV